MSTSLQSTERFGQDAKSGKSQRQSSPYNAAIDILDDDSLLNIFHLYRPFLLGEDDNDEARLFGGFERWERGHWWYKLAHVCQRWRNLMLGSASYLGLYLVCTKGSPIADMLAHSPPLLPLAVDYYYEDSDVSTEDEERLLLALEQRDRVRRIRLRMEIPNLQRLIVAISDEYPILECLIIITPDRPPSLTLPERLQAPHLRHLVLSGFALPIGSRLLTVAVGLVTLVLVITIPSTYIQPNSLLRWISFMPQLETLIIYFFSADHSRTIEGQVTHTSTQTVTPITLPNLRWFWFQGVNAYLEAVIRRITSPRLERLQVFFFDQLTFSIPHLLQFMKNTATTESRNLTFGNAKLDFSNDQVDVATYPHEEADLSQSLHIRVLCLHLDLQVSAMAQISNSLSQMFSTVEHLTLSYEPHTLSPAEHNEVDRHMWRKILVSFRNVKILRVEDGLEEEIARCLRLEDGGGEIPLDLLPELQELTYSRSSHTDGYYASFINIRQNAGRPITLVDLTQGSENPSRSHP
ncbi:hypothetical protein BGY98DRAFT_38765 [Russula aff. rugulosa BPL654]|nr:hypothetical protein BGY98DRAFT_38765 [Russula aff. rugulosa BPL654]